MFSAVSIALGVYPTLGAAYLVGFLVVTTVTIHNFLGMADAAEQESPLTPSDPPRRR